MTASVSVRFQYLDYYAPEPVTKIPLTEEFYFVPFGAPLPRVGEYLTHAVRGDEEGQRRTFVVLAVHHEVQRLADNEQKIDDWFVTVTLGDPPMGMDRRLLETRP